MTLNRQIMKVFGFICLIIISIIYTPVGSSLHITQLPPEKQEVIFSKGDTKDLILQNKEAKTKGNKLDVRVEVYNSDNVSHSGNVTVKLIRNGSEVTRKSKLTGSIRPESTWKERYRFSETDYDDIVVDINQTG